jgi:hypothetical protein
MAYLRCPTSGAPPGLASAPREYLRRAISFKVMSMLFRSLLLGALCIASFPLWAQSTDDSLAGTTWILCENAQPSPGQARDALVFDADGSGRVIRAQGNVGFHYQRSGNTIALSPPGARQAVMLDMEAGHEQMLLRGPDGQPVARYARQGSAAMGRCTAR